MCYFKCCYIARDKMCYLNENMMQKNNITLLKM